MSMGKLSEAWAGVQRDQDYLSDIARGRFRAHATLRALLTNDALRAGFLMRIAARGGIVGRIARTMLLTFFSCDVSAGATIQGGLHIPHPVGIVIGEGVRLVGNVSIFQHVTLGSDGRNGYPEIENGVIIFPNSVVVGQVTVGSRARIGAGSFVDIDVPAGSVFARHEVRASSGKQNDEGSA